MQKSTWEPQEKLNEILGENRGALLSKDKIEIIELKVDQPGYKTLEVEVFILQYTQKIVFIPYQNQFYVLIRTDSLHNKNSYNSLEVFQFRNIRDADDLSYLLDLEGIQIIGDVKDIKDARIIVDMNTFYERAFSSIDDFYVAYALKYHREEFMTYLIRQNSPDRSTFLNLMSSEYHHNLRF